MEWLHQFLCLILLVLNQFALISFNWKFPHQILHAPVYRGMAALGTFLYQGLPALGPFLDQGLSALGTTSDLGRAALGPFLDQGQPALGLFLDQGLAALSTTSDFRAGSPEYNK